MFVQNSLQNLQNPPFWVHKRVHFWCIVSSKENWKGVNK